MRARYLWRAVAALAWLSACGRGPGADSRARQPARPVSATTGAVRGVVTDGASGSPLSFVSVMAEGRGVAAGSTVTTGADGGYHLGALPPGSYRIIAYHGDRVVQHTGVPVGAGKTTTVYIQFDPGAPKSVALPYSRATAATPPEPAPAATRAAATTGAIEGVIIDGASGDPMSGAVVSASSPALRDAQMAIADDRGAYRIANLPPGRYTLSAYYHLVGRGNIEVRKSGIEVEAGVAVPVELRLDIEVDE